MRIKVTMSILLLAAACATQALANYFYNPYANLSMNIGSAASPTPRYTRKNRPPKVRAAPPYAIIVAAEFRDRGCFDDVDLGKIPELE